MPLDMVCADAFVTPIINWLILKSRHGKSVTAFFLIT